MTITVICHSKHAESLPAPAAVTQSFTVTAKPVESRLLAVEEPAMCYSPERRFDAKERRERPPRRYDKGNETGQGEE